MGAPSKVNLTKGINVTGTTTGRIPSNVPNQSATPSPAKGKRGFASMDPERQRQIASMGGREAHRQGVAHQFTSEEARAAGKKRHQKAV